MAKTNKVYFKFIIRLGNLSNKSGIFFNRFLPFEEENMLIKKLSNRKGEISFWFVKNYKIRNSFINGEVLRYDNQVILKDEAKISEQNYLSNALLNGQITLFDITNTTLKAIKNEIKTEPTLEKLGKTIAKTIYNEATTFINIIKHIYRQHRISELEEWDSRSQSLTSYCTDTLNITISIDKGKTWQRFEPTEDFPRTYSAKFGRGKNPKDCFISSNDWNNIKQLFQDSIKPTKTSVWITNCYRSHEKGNFGLAFVEGVTALEMALNERKNNNPKLNDEISKQLNQFNQLKIKPKFIATCLELDEINQNEIINGLKVIEIRNKFVHKDGRVPNGEESELLVPFLHTISKLIGEPTFKTPYIPFFD